MRHITISDDGTIGENDSVFEDKIESIVLILLFKEPADVTITNWALK